MADIKAEILEAVKDKSLIPKVEEEISLMENTDGLDDKPVLQKFYSMWKSSKGKVGHRNDINSWTAYAIGMTDKKPNEGDKFLPKRRAFARKGFPDIDSDFDYERREEMYKYIIDTYGREYVGNIGTYSSLKLRSFITRAVKAIDPENTFFKGHEQWKTETNLLAREILDALPPQYGAFLKVQGEDGQEHAIKTTKDASKWCDKFAYYMRKYPSLLEHSDSIEGLLSTFGCLAANTPILTSDGWIRIDQLSGHKVAFLNKNGKLSYSNKYDCQSTGIKKTYRLRLKNGNFVDITDEHLLFTDKGLRKFEEIRKSPKEYLLYSLNTDPAA